VIPNVLRIEAIFSDAPFCLRHRISILVASIKRRPDSCAPLSAVLPLSWVPFRARFLHTPRPSRKPAASTLASTPYETSLQAPTPTALRCRRPVAGSGAPKTTPLDRRLRALEADQSCSACRAKSGCEHAFATSASSWLSLLLRDPAAYGCSPASKGRGDVVAAGDFFF
jgi:hypothetical protein